MKLARLHNGDPEIFHSLQGEGPHVGRPSIFIRTSHCNLHCIWCDTDYTWNFEGTPWKHLNDSQPNYEKFKKADVILDLPVSEVAELIKEYPCQNLVLTGGEPLLHQRDFVELLKKLGSRYVAEVETNGTQIPTPELDALISNYNVSPKLGHSGNPLKLADNEAAMRWFVASQKAAFKFVIATTTPGAGQGSLAEVQQLQQKYEIPSAQIYLMPEGRTSAEIRNASPELAQICLSGGYQFCDRLHLHLYGNKRGT